ncbi:MAG: hypothetical protein MRERV_32c007 [Mycoplasmataceae bacterium RV_VA103A]|nr:MAG: hypothetical protein MRERV_32c007 [Mycoplasmataceae bacterium RV_VA103A]
MTKEIIIIALVILLIYLYYQQNHPSIDKRSYDDLINDLKRQVQHYQNLYQKRVAGDIDKLNNGSESGTQTDLSDQQINLLVQQWEEVAQWATSEGIDVNQKWNLGLLKGKLAQQQQQFKQEKQTWQEEKTNLIKSKSEELTAKMAELRASKERMEQLYKEQLAAKGKEKEEIIKKNAEEKEEARKSEQRKLTLVREETAKAFKREFTAAFQVEKRQLINQISQEQTKLAQQEATWQQNYEKQEKEKKRLAKELEDKKQKLEIITDLEEINKNQDKEIERFMQEFDEYKEKEQKERKDELRKINLLFNPQATEEEVDFYSLYSFLEQVAEREKNEDSDDAKNSDTETLVLSRKMRRKLRKGKK